MDIAYDHIQENAFNKDEAPSKNDADASEKNEKQQQAQASLNSDIQEAYKAISSSAWGAKIGGFLGTVVKQSETVYQTAQKELTAASTEATRGFSDLRETLINRTRAISLSSPNAQPDSEGDSTTPTADAGRSIDKAATINEEEEEDLLSRLKKEAAKRLKDIQRAEDAADAALLQFGSNVRDFLKDAITVAPPTDADTAAQSTSRGVEGAANSQGATSTVLFESKDAQGKRVIHSTRFDAQLHVLHTNPNTLLKAPEQSEQFTEWEKEFDVEAKTDDIAADLEEYAELRTTMEKIVPEKVSYAQFWCRYYFLRHSIETAENRRKELLKAAAASNEVDAWDDDSEDDESSSDEDSESNSDDGDDDGKDSKADLSKKGAHIKRPVSAGSSRTIQPPKSKTTATTTAAAGSSTPTTSATKTAEGRKSNEGDSDTSYDVVGAASGVPSHAPSKAASKHDNESSDDDESSEEEDWE
ncbi:BSD domain-containing protein C22A12.14c [Ceratocystis lukuohia]|uniref:BSD domain-containing protein C22A12.14c n=1 Tax=Ceratocystis lukuohia TaxID=2019550 RepID=A0ABR4MP77_9PEZI